MNRVIGAEHEFHDEAYVRSWAERRAPTPERLELFDLMRRQLEAVVPADGCIIELGIGPAFLAEHLLGAMPEARYIGIDFSTPMLEIARERLAEHAARVRFVRADLVKDEWWTELQPTVNAIVSTWALHDLGGQDYVEQVYRSCAQALPEGGLLLNGDFIKPDEAKFDYEPGRFEIDTHIEMLRRVGFRSAECLAVLETEIDDPTPAQNYACLKGVV